ncbi:MAG: PAS domain-containing protein [Anaerolineae bacterium]|nr:PAS domain-containing protein [Anaerolineae bacterium]
MAGELQHQNVEFSETEDAGKTKEQLVAELQAARQRVRELEAWGEQVFEKMAERARVEVALRSSQRLMQLIIDNIPMSVYWKNRNSVYLGCNRRFAAEAGFTDPDEIVGKNDFDMPWAEEADLYVADDQHVIESGESKLNVEEQLSTPEGEDIWVRTSKIRMYDADGIVFGVLGLYEDITERKRAEIERSRFQREAIEAQREALRELSTPIIPLVDRIIVIPLIGSIDSLRAKDLMRSLLTGISMYRAKVVLLDITGVPLVDSGIANHLNKTIQAARLKGARTIVTGISDAVAETIVDLGIDWHDVQTLSDLQTGLLFALHLLGIEVTRGRAPVNNDGPVLTGVPRAAVTSQSTVAGFQPGHLAGM